MVGKGGEIMENKKTSNFVGAKEFAEIFEVTENTAYLKIREINANLRKQGYIIIQGKIPRRVFNEMCPIFAKEKDAPSLATNASNLL